MPNRTGTPALCAALLALTCGVAWAQTDARPDATAGADKDKKAAATPSDKAKAGAQPGVAATVGGKPITMAEVDAQLLASNMKLAQQLYEARQAALDDLIMERLLAAEAEAKGVPLDQFVQQRIDAKIEPVTDEDVKKFYDENVARMRGRTLEQMASAIRSHVEGQRKESARGALLAELKAGTDIRVMLDPPRVEVKLAANDPVKGPADAKVTVVEYSEFQ